MPKGSTDPRGTACEAVVEGVTRRAIQKRRKKLLEDSDLAVRQSRPDQLVMPFEPSSNPWPDERRIDPIASACRAGAIEEAVSLELKRAVQSGNAPMCKVLSSCWADVVRCVSLLEELAERRVKDLKSRAETREWITLNFEEVKRRYSPAYIRSNMPSITEENQSCIEPMTEEEGQRAYEWEKLKDSSATGKA